MIGPMTKATHMDCRISENAAASLFRRGVSAIEAGTEALAVWVSDRPWRFVVVTFLIYGYGCTDFAAFARLTQDPFTTLPDKGEQFLHSSPLEFFLGWPFTRWLGPEPSYVIVIALGLATLCAAFAFYARKLTSDGRAIVLMVMFSSPLLIVLFRWLGKDDPFILAFLLMFVALRGNGPAEAGLALLLVLAHKEIGTIVVIADGLLRKSLRWPAVLGILVGHGTVSAYIAGLSMPPFSRVDFNLALFRISVAGWITNPLTHLCLSFTWFWIFLLRLWREDGAWRIFTVTAGTFAVAAGAADFTRVVLMATSPVLIYVAERIASSPLHAGAVYRRPFPLLFLLQFQIEAANQVRDLMWPTRLLEWSKAARAIIGWP